MRVVSERRFASSSASRVRASCFTPWRRARVRAPSSHPRSLEREPTRQEEVLRVTVGDVLDVTGAAESGHLALQDDAH